MSIDWPMKLSLPSWSETEFVCFILGVDPEQFNNNLLDKDKLKLVEDLKLRFKREAIVGNLPHHTQANDIYYPPNSTIAWAVRRGFPVIPELKDYISTVIENRTGCGGEFQFLTDIVKESPKSLDAGWIAELWAAIPGESYVNKPFWQIRDDYKKHIESAVIGGELEAIVEEHVKAFDDGFKEITDKNRIRKIKDGWLGHNFVRFTIHRENFKQWLVSSNQWPIADGCLLNQWLVEQQTETVANVGAASFKSVWYHFMPFMQGEIEQTIGTEALSIDWTYWLSEPSWTKEEAVLLVYGLNPIQLYQVDINKDYKSTCEPFIKFCKRTIEESGTPYYWLNKFNIEGYLDSVPTGVREWLAQQIEHTQLEPQAEAVDIGADNKDETKAKERELTKWMRETWIAEDKPGGTAFFNALKKYVNENGSPIVEHYTAGKKGAGIRWNTGNATNHMTKKTIQTKVSEYKNSLQQNSVNRKDGQ
ncbi:MAG: hypothetical protein Q8Q40_16480 [Methylococcaceae bacterium]|nr:hypothetical protein [Methylococcaceae bacterium]MDP3905550.1 hypothetical protein [Methylococcaceae bacterium]